MDQITNIQQQLERDEGRSLVVYADSLGFPTIGIGHKLQPWEHYPQGISADQCDQLFRMDLINVQNAIRSHLPWVLSLDDPRCGVFENMCFNMGIWRLLQFKDTIAAAQEHDWQKTAAAMNASRWEHQVPERADRLEKQMIVGVWQ